MPKKSRQNKPPRRMSKEQQAFPEMKCAPEAREAVESGEGLIGLESVTTEAEAPPPSSPMPVSSLEEALPDASETALPMEEETSEVAPEELELLTFNLEDEEYAVDIGLIQEITKLTEITLIPRIQSYIRGIITLRGNVIPVFDMRARLGLAPFVNEPKSRFIICTTENGMVAMLVDRVNDVVRLMRRHLEPTPAGVAAVDAGFIKSIARHEGRLLIFLDIEKTLQIN